MLTRFLRHVAGPMLVAALCAIPAPGQSPAAPKALFEQLNRAAINPSEVYVIRNVRFSRDRANFYLNRGFIGFFEPVGGEVTGAAFVGDGEVLLMPRDNIERAHLARFTQAGILNERFTSACFRFTDHTARELMSSVRRPEPDDAEQPGEFVESWAPIIRKLNPEYSMRILLDLLGEHDKPCFLAYLQGSALGTFQVEVDERAPEAVRVGAVRRAGNLTFSDLWCAFPSARSKERLEGLMMGSFRAESFRIDTRINLDHSLEGRAELTLESRSSQDRVVTLEFSRFLKVTEAQDGDGTPLTLFQNPGEESAETVRRETDWIAVILPKPYPVGAKFQLRFGYQGSVISDAGNGVLHVGERTNWYPNRGVFTRSDFDLTFHYPDQLTLVATGDRVEETVSDGWKHSRWKSAGPQPVAGFNLGAYRSSERRAGGIRLQVFATREVEASIDKNVESTLSLGDAPNPRFPKLNTGVTQLPNTPIPPNPASMLDNVADLAAETISRYEELFGPLSVRGLAVTQVPGHFGQGWPGLVYLPTMVFLPKAQRTRLGLNGRPEEFSNELMLAHEIAHQWWGNQIGWQTYHDQWLSEGFATYSAALQIAAGNDGDRKFREILRQYKADLISKTPQGATVESGGPIYLGYRLSNSQNPDGFNDIIYKKSCWALHMLRELMDSGPRRKQEPFFTMLRDFMATFRGRSASTQDFIHYAEKYMTPSMDLEHNRRLEWFFDDWVYGTGIPEYKLSVAVKRSGPKKCSITGKIQQTGVPTEFEMPVPLIARYGRGRSERLGWVVVDERGGEFRFTSAEKPERVAIDEDSILAVVK
ncbi:MAG: hypothetical protein HY508_15380 [Acidobacteria bacterium]|nr:hypothetical protein [Acidobacteriota bacterium]